MASASWLLWLHGDVVPLTSGDGAHIVRKALAHQSHQPHHSDYLNDQQMSVTQDQQSAFPDTFCTENQGSCSSLWAGELGIRFKEDEQTQELSSMR